MIAPAIINCLLVILCSLLALFHFLDENGNIGLGVWMAALAIFNTAMAIANYSTYVEQRTYTYVISIGNETYYVNEFTVSGTSIIVESENKTVTAVLGEDNLSIHANKKVKK